MTKFILNFQQIITFSELTFPTAEKPDWPERLSTVHPQLVPEMFCSNLPVDDSNRSGKNSPTENSKDLYVSFDNMNIILATYVACFPILNQLEQFRSPLSAIQTFLHTKNSRKHRCRKRQTTAALTLTKLKKHKYQRAETIYRLYVN